MTDITDWKTGEELIVTRGMVPRLVVTDHPVLNNRFFLCGDSVTFIKLVECEDAEGIFRYQLDFWAEDEKIYRAPVIYFVARTSFKGICERHGMTNP